WHVLCPNCCVQFAAPAASIAISPRNIIPARSSCNAMFVTPQKQLLERVCDFVQFVCLVIPPIHSLGVTIRVAVGQKNKPLAAAVAAYGKRPWREARPLASQCSLTDNVITSSLEPLSVAVIEDRVQPPLIASRSDLAAIVAAHLHDVPQR